MNKLVIIEVFSKKDGKVLTNTNFEITSYEIGKIIDNMEMDRARSCFFKVLEDRVTTLTIWN